MDRDVFRLLDETVRQNGLAATPPRPQGPADVLFGDMLRQSPPAKPCGRGAGWILFGDMFDRKGRS